MLSITSVPPSLHYSIPLESVISEDDGIEWVAIPEESYVGCFNRELIPWLTERWNHASIAELRTFLQPHLQIPLTE